MREDVPVFGRETDSNAERWLSYWADTYYLRDEQEKQN